MSDPLWQELVAVGRPWVFSRNALDFPEEFINPGTSDNQVMIVTDIGVSIAGDGGILDLVIGWDAIGGVEYTPWWIVRLVLDIPIGVAQREWHGFAPCPHGLRPFVQSTASGVVSVGGIYVAGYVVGRSVLPT